MDLGEFQRNLYRPKKIVVCVPWGSPFMWMHTAFNLMNLIHPEGVEVMFSYGLGRNPGERHLYGALKAIEWGASHICFMGADQVHDRDTLVKLCTHAENGWPVVVAAVPIRGRIAIDGVTKPFQKVVWKWKNDERPKSGAEFNEDFLAVIDPMDGPYQEVACIGSGVMLLDINLLHAMEKPWFMEAPPNEQGFTPAKMDTHFSYRLQRDAGAKILVDLTIEVKHLDVFPVDETYGIRFGDWTNEQRGGYDYTKPPKTA